MVYLYDNQINRPNDIAGMCYKLGPFFSVEVLIFLISQYFFDSISSQQFFSYNQCSSRIPLDEK